MKEEAAEREGGGLWGECASTNKVMEFTVVYQGDKMMHREELGYHVYGQIEDVRRKIAGMDLMCWQLYWGGRLPRVR